MARGFYFNYAQQGGSTVSTDGFSSLTKVQRSFPGATVTVYAPGTTSTITLYSDSGGTPKANPFTAGSDASFSFWTDQASFDITFSGTGITTGCGGAGQLACIPAFTWSNQSTIVSASSYNFNVKSYGAVGDLRTVTDGSISSSQTTLTSATAAFTTADVGKQVQVAGAGAAGATLYTTISAYISSTQVTVALAASTGVSGATTKIYTDDGVAIGLASAALQAAGRGTLYFPPGVYGTYGKGTSYTALGSFTGLTNINLIGDGAVIFVSGEHTNSTSGLMFQFTSCVGITVDGFDVQGEITTALIQSGTFFNQKFLVFWHDCSNVNIPRLRATGIGVPVEFNNNPSGTYDGLPHTKGVHIGVLEANSCVYGLDAQFSMDDAVIDELRTNVVLRSMFIYGSSGVSANIYSKDAYGDDVKLWATQGYGLSNIRINYTSDATSLARSNGNPLVTLEWVGPTAATHKNISINYNVVFAGSGTANTGLNAFLIRKLTNGGASFDSVDRGHILDGLTLSGRIENYPQLSGYGIIDVDPNGQWGATLDSWYNIYIHDLACTNSRFARLSLRSLKGPLSVRNFRSNVELVLSQDNSAADTSFPSGGQTKVVNCSYPNQYTISGGQIPSNIVYVQVAGNVATGWQEQTIVNTGTTGTTTLTLPSAVIGRNYTFYRTVANTLRVAPQAADQIRGASAANKYISLDATGIQAQLVCSATGFWDVIYTNSTGNYSFQP